MDFAVKVFQQYGLGGIAILAIVVLAVNFANRMNTMQTDITARVETNDTNSRDRARKLEALLETRGRDFLERMAKLEREASTDLAKLEQFVRQLEEDIDKLEQRPELGPEEVRFRDSVERRFDHLMTRGLGEEAKRFRANVTRRFAEDRERIGRIEAYIFDLSKERDQQSQNTPGPYRRGASTQSSAHSTEYLCAVLYSLWCF